MLTSTSYELNKSEINSLQLSVINYFRFKQETDLKFDNGLVDPSYIEWIRMGTTVATNSLLTHNGSKFCLVITKGFRDVLYIGNQSRPNLFDLVKQLSLDNEIRFKPRAFF